MCHDSLMQLDLSIGSNAASFDSSNLSDFNGKLLTFWQIKKSEKHSRCMIEIYYAFCTIKSKITFFWKWLVLLVILVKIKKKICIVGLAKLDKSDKLQRVIRAKRWMDPNFEDHSGISYHITTKLAILRLIRLEWPILELLWRGKI